jgi:peptidoglycan/xylan/chitin deacetylase (PgdA/CDA1 family)
MFIAHYLLAMTILNRTWETLLKSLPSLPDDAKRALIVTHDVDWPLNGPGASHVLARRERFPPEVINKVIDEGFNPYYGIPKIMEIEEKFGIRSTFFFRPKYDDCSEISQYEKTIRTLISRGWEVGLHANNTSILEEVNLEKKLVEQVAGKPVYGSRVHYLKVSENTFSNLAQSGIKYDSSLSFDKEHIDPRNTGFLVKSGLVVFPVTFMDAYLFTYMGLTEETIVPFMVKTIEKLFASGIQIMTLLWHDNSVMMKGGRSYAELIKQLTANSNITFLKGIEAFELVKKQKAS